MSNNYDNLIKKRYFRRLRHRIVTIRAHRPPRSRPKLIIVPETVMKLFSTHLCGDVTGDGTVDIREVGRLSKCWELTV
jgi:hypothetical protein